MAFWKEEKPLLTKNALLENVTKKLGPLIMDKTQKNGGFFLGERPLSQIKEKTCPADGGLHVV